ncbi:hypothetical protein ACOMHN_033253 [Nucella lapillus]
MEEQQHPTQKTDWPELVGQKGEDAEKVIKKENPHLSISRVLEGQPVTMDYRPDRVRIIVNAEDIVISTPITG